MKQLLQTTRLGLTISLILTAFVVNADTAKTMTSQVKYNYYYRFNHHSEKKYYRFLPNPVPEELYYHTRMTADENIDDTPEKETVVLMVVGSKPRADFGNWHQAFLLITSTKAGKIERKALFKLFDVGTHPLNVRAAKAIELHNLAFGLKQPLDVSFKLADLTGDGTLDVWVESAYGVALVSFENGEFQEVLTNYTVTRKKLAEASDIEYYWYNYNGPSDPEGEKYHRFLPALAPKERYYNTRMTATANVDDTPEKETIVLITTDTGYEGPRGEWTRAFLLIAETEGGVLKKKELFKLFDTGTHAFDVPGKTVEVQSAPFVFRKRWSDFPGGLYYISFELVDLTGDEILDLWVERAIGMVVISFQNGEFKEVCSGYSSIRRKDPMEYVDLDNDGIYEIKIPDRILVSRIPGPAYPEWAAYPEWVSLYEWDGTTYVLNNERFYANNDEFLIGLLNTYNHVLIRHGRFDEYGFYIGLVFYYRGDVPMARKYLQWVVKNAEKQAYIQAAESLLKKLPPQREFDNKN